MFYLISDLKIRNENSLVLILMKARECVAQRYDSRRSCKRSRVRSRPVPHEFSSLPANLRERRVLTSFIISVLTGNSKLLVKLSWACIGVYLPLAKLVVFQLCLNC